MAQLFFCTKLRINSAVDFLSATANCQLAMCSTPMRKHLFPEHISLK